MDIDSCNTKYNPADKYPLYKDEKGEPCIEDWDYRSTVGIIRYLEGSNLRYKLVCNIFALSKE